MKCRIVVNQGEPIPKWYGVGRRDWAYQQSICYPVPFNWLIARVIDPIRRAVKVPTTARPEPCRECQRLRGLLREAESKLERVENLLDGSWHG